MLTSNLGELGVGPELFFEACQRGRNSRDINRTVYDRMIAMDDFLTFKKIMVKRNMELQLEAMQSLQETKKSRDYKGLDDDDDDSKVWRVMQESM